MRNGEVAYMVILKCYDPLVPRTYILRALRWVLSVAVGGTMLLSGCRREVLRVVLPPDFHGNVAIGCAANQEVDMQVMVNSRGVGTASSCPRAPVDLTIICSGRPVGPINTPHWVRRGDGAVAGVSFAVR
jgi:hypothetical protein